MVAKGSTRFLVTFKKVDLEQLDALVEAFKQAGIPCSRSTCLRKAFMEYLKMIVYAGQINKATEDKGEEKKDA